MRRMRAGDSGRGVGRLAASLRRARAVVAARRKTFYAILAAGILVFWLAVWPFTRAHLQAIAVLRDVAGQPVPWAARALTVPVSTQDFSFAISATGGERQVRARMYLPRNRPNAPGILIFHGVHHLGIDEPRLMGFARAMASCGVRVLTPELPGIKDYHVSEDSVETIGESVKWMAARTGRAGAGGVGVMGLSFAGGLALVAAEDPRYRASFKFVVAVGAQDSMMRVSQYYLTGRDVRPDGSVEVLRPHEYGPLVIEYQYLREFVPAADLEALRAVLRAHLYEDKQGETDAIGRLNEAQKAEALALMDTSLPATHAKIAEAIAGHAYESPKLSPEEHLGTLTTPVYLLHGEADNIIPSAETLWMERELPRRYLRAALVSPVLSHIDLEAQPGMMDEWRLVHMFALIVDAAEKR